MITNKTYKELSLQETAIIDAAQSKLSEYIARLVLLGTYDLVRKMMHIINLKVITDIFIGAIKDDKYVPVDNALSTIEENIVLDYLNNDIPLTKSEKN